MEVGVALLSSWLASSLPRGGSWEEVTGRHFLPFPSLCLHFFNGPGPLCSSADQAPRQAKACLFPPAQRERGGSDQPSFPPITLGPHVLMGPIALWSSTDRAPRQAKAYLFPPARRELGGSDRPSLPPNPLGLHFVHGPGRAVQ
ncbi:hypothetical protein NDU88_001631 [Pleurodeles waltl]|uniref:Uncharacterized protein n=1 Tax=Pleurodeles waltl TaxID=8319 RepID=A0AAV7WL43_PLEWA|nr:hypothetical protein NDU88_001631 [Pleurodeles waltl]